MGEIVKEGINIWGGFNKRKEDEKKFKRVKKKAET